jgi:hypothetical protein
MGVTIGGMSMLSHWDTIMEGQRRSIQAYVVVCLSWTSF